MAVLRRRRFRLPVLGRLAWAWTLFAGAAGAFGAWSLLAGQDDGKAARIALAMPASVATTAPPALRSVMPARAEADLAAVRLAAGAPPLREGGEAAPVRPSAIDLSADAAPRREPAYADATDALDNEGDWLIDAYAEPDILEQPGPVVITIDGAPARKPGERAAEVQNASLRAPGPQIADPDPALLRSTPLGAIPRIAADGRKSSKAYARPFNAAKGKRVAVIVGGLGLNRALTARAIDELPPEITLAFAPYAKDLDLWTARAREAGHEIMIELPMEGRSESVQALGPAALLTTRSDEENLQRLDWLLSRFGAYFAATNYQGAKFSADARAMGAVLARLDELGVGYVDDTGAARRAMASDADSAVVNRMIAPGDSGADLASARRDLTALEAIAARSGAALGKAYAYDATIEAIREWAEALDGRDVVLAPASAVLGDRGV